MRQWSADDISFMALALSLARGQLGKTATNPAVGCVIVKNGHILGQGATAQGGRPHGEAMALLNAQGPVDGATVYVTLEPCNHISDRGPSCAASLVEAKIARLVCCLEDPDPRTAGKGFERLRHAGIIVDVGLLKDEGTRQIADFSTRLKT
jgi:diaminohydroxyphosphoribosylaminopyrimidine deaminase / 5-amino-6-(5-phosphoribosylamino)uracil reductase